MLSTIVALTLTSSQARPLGDEPIAMLALGGLLAFTAGTLRKALALHLGIAAMSGFPIVAVIDMCRGGDHNLWPFEFVLYAVYAGIGVVLAGVGKLLGGLLSRR